MSTELAVRPTTSIAHAAAEDFMPMLSIEQAVQRYNTIVEFTRQVLRKDRDYGVIPGTAKNRDGTPSNKDNVLFKAGAEKLSTIFGLTTRFEDYRVVEDWEAGLFYYAYRCIQSRNGRDIAECIGSANSREKKYRRETRTCPECERPTIKKGFPKKNEKTWTWYCDRKAGGCGRNFASDDPAIVDQKAGIDVNAAADAINTIQKIAQKRAYVGCTLIATNASEFFTQDLDDTDPPTGHHDDGVIDAQVVAEAEPVQDFADWGEFEQAIADLAASHGIDAKMAWNRLVFPELKAATGQTNGNGAYKASDPSMRAKVVASMKGVTAEQIEAWKKLVSKAQSAPPADHWRPFEAAAKQAADAADVAADVLVIAMDTLAESFGVPTNLIPPETLAEILAAMKAGRFDWATGKVREAAQPPTAAKPTRAGQQRSPSAA